PPVDPEDVPQALARLADHSLLVVTPGPDGTCYRLLETVSQYGGELLDEVGEHDAVHARHLAWCQSLAAALETGEGARAPAFEAVVDDLRAALTWASGEPDRRAAAHELALRLARLAFSHRLLRESQRRYEQAAALAGNDAEAAEALHLAAGAAAAGLWGNETVRLYRAAADAARRAGDRRRAALDLARTVECAHRFPGIMHELLSQEELATLLAEARVLAGGDPHVEAAILTATATAPNIGDRDPLNAELAERAVELARRVDDARLESGALDQLEVSQLAVGDVLGAAAGAQRRVALLSPRWGDVDVAFELSDALHMAAMTSIGVGDLAAGRDFARQRLDLPFHGEERHMAVDWLLVVAALAGDLDEAVELTRRFRAGWERAGRPPWGGFAVTPAAAAMVFGLRGDDQAREEWLGILAEMRRVVAPVMERIPRFGPTFEALVALHRGELDAASAALAEDPGSVPHWHTGVWNQWYSALWAETTVLAERPDRYDRLARARMITARNPIAAAVVDRAEALAAGDRAGLVASAAAFEAAGCRYQRARTLVLAGGDERVEGEAALAALGAAPMALQADWLTRRIRRA
ncbi:MAG TPA: hypothetical protein VE575_17670, partial [Acidimicrobiales bacterium]|nr:hypothetical protein [Acidimicrobiales bacterium]